MWTTAKLDEIVTLSMGKTPSRGNAKFWDKEKKTKNIWLSIADLTALDGLYVKDSKEYVSDEGAKLFKMVPPDTLIMSFKLSIGKLAITKCELRTNEAIVALPIKDKKLITKEYLYYFLSSIDWDALAGDDIKVKGKTLNKAKLKEIRISFPTIAEQNRIVAKLDEAFEGIDSAVKLAEQKSRQVDVMQQNVISKCFADATNNHPERRMSECYDVRDGTHDSPKYVAKGIRLVTSKNLKTGTLDLKNTKLISEEDYNQIIRRSKVDIGDVLMAMIGTIGNPVLIEKEPDYAIKNVALFKVDSSKQDGKYLQYFLINSTNKMINEANGTTQKFVGLGYLRNLLIPQPLLLEQKEISRYLFSIEVSARKIKGLVSDKISNLNTLKSAILAHELQSGAT
jgi:type I restriction enzyme S subunit